VRVPARAPAGGRRGRIKVRRPNFDRRLSPCTPRGWIGHSWEWHNAHRCDYGKGTVTGRVTKHEEVAVGEELMALAVAALATMAVMIVAIIVGLNAPPAD